MKLNFSDLLELRLAVIHRVCMTWKLRNVGPHHRESCREAVALLRKLRTMTRECYL
jgi:hypothetical protein